MSGPRRSWASLLLAVGGAALLLSGCYQETQHTLTSISPALAREAAAFGGWVLPGDAEVLLSAKDVITDAPGNSSVYKIAVATTPAGLREMLAASRFSAPFSGGHGVLPEVIAGPPLDSSPSVVFAEDHITNPAGDEVTRSVVVDERDAVTRNVHLTFSSETT